jgi:glutaredoxin 3
MKKAIIYTTPTCQYCKMAKTFFQQHNVQYEEHDVASDDKAREEMLNKSHQMGVPVIDIEGEIFVGFNQREISKALGIS